MSGVSKAYADRRVLSDVGFTARAGDRIGLIGENGAGKSTLLRIMGGSEAPDSGEVILPASVGSLAQELPYPDETALSRVLDDAQEEALAALAAIEAAGAAWGMHPEDPGVADAYAEALERTERSGAWQAEARRGEVLTGLGLGGKAPDTPVGRLSGGERVRLALAALLLRAPHTILLDEPSNHLDDASAAYLERVLADWPGIVVFASHDRALLDAVATRIVDLDAAPSPLRARLDDDDPGTGLGIRVWGMGYSAAREAQRAEFTRWRERYAAEEEERTSLVHEIDVGSREVNRKHESKSESRITRKFYADKDARVTARRARNARVRLEQLERERVRQPPEPLRFGGAGLRPRADASAAGSEAPNAIAAGEPLLRADALGLSERLAPTSLLLPAGGRLLLTGPNGAGKSTLLAILAGELKPDTGSFATAPGAAVGHLPQEASFAAPDRSAAETYARAVGDETAESLPLAETGLLAPRDVGRAVGALSVGQRRRLALAILLASLPPVLLLDEPTNHLSLALVEELEDALRAAASAGPDGSGIAVVIASHDRWLRSRWEGEALAIAPARA